MEDEDSLGGSAYANYLTYVDRSSLRMNNDGARAMLDEMDTMRMALGNPRCNRYTDPYEAAVRAQEEIDAVARTAQRPGDANPDAVDGMRYAIQEMERNRTSKYYEKEEPEVEPDPQSLEIILRRMKLGLKPYVYKNRYVSAISEFVCCDIDEFDPDYNPTGRPTVNWLHPRIYEKIKSKCKEVQDAIDLMDKTEKEYEDKRDEIRTTILSLVESTKNLETKGHDFIL
jgi:hypothetical protein